jgi:hypothetical protein
VGCADTDAEVTFNPASAEQVACSNKDEHLEPDCWGDDFESGVNEAELD